MKINDKNSTKKVKDTSAKMLKIREPSLQLKRSVDNKICSVNIITH